MNTSNPSHSVIVPADPTQWNESGGRRRFLMRTGAASIATMLVIHGTNAQTTTSPSYPLPLCLKALPETSVMAEKDMRLTETGGTRYNLHFRAWDGPRAAPSARVTAKLKVVSQLFKFGGVLEGYPGITTTLPIGELAGKLDGRKLVCTKESLENTPPSDSGWVFAAHGAENYCNTSHYYRWITSEGKVKFEKEADDFIFKRTDLSLSFFMTTLSYRIGTEPPKAPDKTHEGKPVETGTLAFGLSLRVVPII